MARVVVVGGGLAGIATAVRVAKNRHQVVLVEAADVVGGQLRPRTHDGFEWDRWTPSMTLPATLRDLFRKSGRPIDTALALHHLSPGRLHVFADQSRLELPLGSRADQRAALDGWQDGGERWEAYVDGLAAHWDLLRRHVYEVPFHDPRVVDRQLRTALHVRRDLRRDARRFRRVNPNLRALIADDARCRSQLPRATPAFTAMWHYVERTFGRWTPAGGTAALLTALEKRLAERRVEVVTGRRVHDVRHADDRVLGVDADGGAIDADVVVWAAPSPVPALGDDTGLPTVPGAITHLGLHLDHGLPDLPVDTTLHGNPVTTIHRGGRAPAGYAVWTVQTHGDAGEDVLALLRRRGLDVRDQVVARLDVSPVEQVREVGSSPSGRQWQGWRTLLDRPGVRVPLDGLHVVGVNAHPGPETELVLLGAAAAATEIGKP